MKAWQGWGRGPRKGAAPARARVLGALALALLMAACGGGGGGGAAPDPGSSGTTTPGGGGSTTAGLPRDEWPSAAPLTLDVDAWFPIQGNLVWTYSKSTGGTPMHRSVTMYADPGAGADARLLRTHDPVDGSYEQMLRRTAQGWVQPAPLDHSLSPIANQLIGDLLWLPSPMPAVGSVRRHLRGGDYGIDIDGDGRNENFELEFRQSVLGFESVALTLRTVQALHLRTELLLRVMPSRTPAEPLSASAVTDDWLAEGLGPVRSDFVAYNSSGGVVSGPSSLMLTGLTLDGHDVLTDIPVSRVKTLSLTHRDLIYDAARQRYYASVPGSVIGQGNRIAIIDAASGVIGYSEVVGSDPGALALAADGSSLYVALDGSGEVLRLALPGLTEIGRVRLPTSSFFGQLGAQSLAASPVDAGTLAVALSRPGVSPTHGGVVLLRNGVLQPRSTQEHTGSNRIVFSADGRTLYGANTESTEFGLRRIDVVDDGLVEVQVLRDATAFYLRVLDRIGELLMVGPRSYTGDLQPVARISGAFECRLLSAVRSLCLTGTQLSSLTLLVANPQNGVLERQLSVAAPQNGAAALVPGPAGQVAVRANIGHPVSRDAPQILLVSDERLR